MNCKRSIPFSCLFILFVAICNVASAADTIYPGERWETTAPGDVGLNVELLAKARDYALTGEGSGMVTRNGRVVMAWGDQRRRYDLKSTTKSIGMTALGLAIKDGKIKLADQARDHHPTLGQMPPSNIKTGWLDKITILHLATQTAGFEKPGGYTKLLFEPGTNWDYSDSGPNWLAECVTLAYRRDVHELMNERVFSPLGISAKDLTWRNNSYRPRMIEGVARREFGSGVSANVDAMARIGYLYLRRGTWRGESLIPADFVDRCRTTVPQVVGLPEHDGKNYDNASDHYGLLWWNNADGALPDIPRDAYWSWGLYDSLIVVIPSLDIVAARAGKSWKRNWSGHYDVLKPFLNPIVAAVENSDGGQAKNETKRSAEPATIGGIEWAPADTIVRLARGSDNWPMTWADDDQLYTAYGDGRGFRPFVERKLSMGFARISGMPPKIAGENISSKSGEQLGDGARGKKASGMLMVDGVLYLLARNAGNAQLAWSADHGQSWTWADWKFTESFGCPTFLNFGKNYAGARDDFVYVYSFDSDSAYQAADRMVLARAPRDRLTDKSAYEFFARLDDRGEPVWTRDAKQRGAVLARPGKCYRGGVSYNAPLKAYLWAMLPGGDTRFEGGLAVYAASQPWGPWREIFATDRWDVGPGESAHFPTKWISGDGRTLHLVFSGDDTFAVRRATLLPR